MRQLSCLVFKSLEILKTYIMAVRFEPKKNVYTYYERNDEGKRKVNRHEAFVDELSTMVDDLLVGVSRYMCVLAEK